MNGSIAGCSVVGGKAMLKKGEKKVGVGGKGKAKAPQGSKPSIKYVVTVGIGKDGSVQQNKCLAT